MDTLDSNTTSGQLGQKQKRPSAGGNHAARFLVPNVKRRKVFRGSEFATRTKRRQNFYKNIGLTWQ
jgi:hypothetical protein